MPFRTFLLLQSSEETGKHSELIVTCRRKGADGEAADGDGDGASTQLGNGPGFVSSETMGGQEVTRGGGHEGGSSRGRGGSSRGGEGSAISSHPGASRVFLQIVFAGPEETEELESILGEALGAQLRAELKALRSTSYAATTRAGPARGSASASASTRFRNSTRARIHKPLYTSFQYTSQTGSAVVLSAACRFGTT